MAKRSQKSVSTSKSAAPAPSTPRRRTKRTGVPEGASRARAKPTAARETDTAAHPSGPADAQHAPASFSIVGVGASAGGLEAFTQMLAGMPERPNAALVFVQHLAPQHESSLPVLLRTKTALPVEQVTSGTRVEPNRVYVVPPNAQMAIEDRTLRLEPRPSDHTQYTPIDHFFTSLARAQRNRAIAVLLSGSSSDGVEGIREIKAAGGFTIAQAPESAKYDAMPQAAVAAGVVDLVLPPGDIGKWLYEMIAHPYLGRTPVTRGPEISDAQLAQIFTLLRRTSGVDFTNYKLPTVRRRLARRMALHRMTDVAEYIRHLGETPGEVTALYQDFLIHVTRFFRDPESFRVLERDVFPPLVDHRASDVPVRVWVPGCATGEEAYSVGIALLDHLGQHAPQTRLQIFATDVSETALEHARGGTYPTGIAADVPVQHLKRYFTRSDGGYKVVKTLRDVCVFARHDLTRDPPFSKLDLIVCRNVLIYLEAALQRQLVATFHYALNPNGFLMLGPAETVGHQQLFTMIDKKWRLFRKAGVGHVVTQHGLGPSADRQVEAAARRHLEPQRREVKSLQEEADRLIIRRFSPSGVIVNANFQILHFRGQTGTFLEPASGEPNLSLLKMAREGLLYPLRSALQQAKRRNRPVRKDDVRVRNNGGWRDIALEVIPFTGAGDTHFLVLFEDVAPKTARRARKASPAKRRGTESDTDARLTGLTRELAASREYMQSIIQELEATNEELQSANEEILSANEELQSTNEELDTAKEELQSTNEELNTVNEELHARNDELTRVNSDLVNLLSSVDITIVIVGDDLRIRRFTPAAERVLNLIPTDVGRPIGQINPNIVCPDLERLISDAVDRVAQHEREVQDRSGHWYSLRVRPYKNVDNRIEGAVLALIDIDAAKRSGEMLERIQHELATVVRFARQPLALLDSEHQVRTANDAFYRLLGVAQHSGDGAPVPEAVRDVLQSPQLGALLDDLGAAPADGLRLERDLPHRGRRTLEIKARALHVEERKGWTLLALEDVTDREKG